MWVVILSNDLVSSQSVLCCDICAFIFLLACTYFGFITAVTHYSTVSHSSDNVTICGNLRNCCIITKRPNYQAESIGFGNAFLECIPVTFDSQFLRNLIYLLSSLVIVKTTSVSSNRPQWTNWPKARYSLYWTTKQEIFSFFTLVEES